MRVRMLKAVALAVMAGTLLQFGACLSLNQWPYGVASNVAASQVLQSGAALGPIANGGVGG